MMGKARAMRPPAIIPATADHGIDTAEFVRSAWERLNDEARQELWDPLFEPVTA